MLSSDGYSLHLHLLFFFFYFSGDHRDLHSFPTRRSSDLNDRAFLYSQPAFQRLRESTAAQVDGPRVAAHSALGEGELRSEEHTSELQSHSDLVCRLLLEKKKKKTKQTTAGIK